MLDLTTFQNIHTMTYERVTFHVRQVAIREEFTQLSLLLLSRTRMMMEGLFDILYRQQMLPSLSSCHENGCAVSHQLTSEQQTAVPRVFTNIMYFRAISI